MSMKYGLSRAKFLLRGEGGSKVIFSFYNKCCSPVEPLLRYDVSKLGHSDGFSHGLLNRHMLRHSYEGHGLAFFTSNV